MCANCVTFMKETTGGQTTYKSWCSQGKGCTGIPVQPEPPARDSRSRVEPVRYSDLTQTLVKDAFRRKLVKTAARRLFEPDKVFTDLTDQESQHMSQSKAGWLGTGGGTGLVEQTTREYRKDVRESSGQFATLGSHVSHIYAAANGGCNHAMNYLMCGANFNLAYGKYHDPVIAYMAGASRTMTAYLVCCHFAEDDGESLVDPEELYLAGKNAVYGTRDAAIAFMNALDE